VIVYDLQTCCKSQSRISCQFLWSTSSIFITALATTDVKNEHRLDSKVRQNCTRPVDDAADWYTAAIGGTVQQWPAGMGRSLWMPCAIRARSWRSQQQLSWPVVGFRSVTNVNITQKLAAGCKCNWPAGNWFQLFACKARTCALLILLLQFSVALCHLFHQCTESSTTLPRRDVKHEK